MDVKRKTIAIWIILLLITIPIGIAQAGETEEKKENNENNLVELVSYKSDEISDVKSLFLSDEETFNLENTINDILKEIQTAKSMDDLENILDTSALQSSPIIFSALKTLIKSKLSRSRSIVISSGRGYNFNFLKKNEFKITKKLSFWHYSSGNLFKDRTIILQPLAFNMKVLKGRQVGFMSTFTGIYIFVSRKLPQKSFTFFLGTAPRINGIEVFPSI